MAGPPQGPRMTVRDRILIHLAEHVAAEGEFQAPPQVTQGGVAEAVGIRLSHVPQYVRPLAALGLVLERTAHVQGGRQRRKVYFLTGPGKNEAARLRSHVMDRTVEVEDDAGRRAVVLRDALRSSFRGVPLLQVLAVLEAQGSLRVPPEGGAHPATGRWADLTQEAPLVQHFYGRTEEMHRLEALLESRPVVVVQGVPGIGKSTLGARLVERHRGRGHLLWHQFRPWDTPEAILRGLGNLLQGAGRPALLRHLRAAATLDLTAIETILDRDLAGIDALVVYDDLQKAPGSVVEFLGLLRGVVTRVPGPRLLLLTREFIPVYDRRDVKLRGTVGEMELGGLDPEASRQLLGESATAALVEASRGHPLLLELVRAGSPGSSARLDFVRFVEDELYLQLPPGERAIVRVGALFDEAVPAGALLVDGGSADDLAHLRRRGIVHEVQGGMVQVHDVLRDSLRAALGPDERKLRSRATEALVALADAQANPVEALPLLQAASAVAPPGPGGSTAHRRLAEGRLAVGDYRGALEAVDVALHRGSGSDAGALHDIVAQAYLALGDVTAALGASARALEAMPGDRRVHLVRGEALLRSGNPGAALRLTEALLGSGGLGRREAAAARSLHGQILLFLGRTTEGLDHLTGAVETLRPLGGGEFVDALLAVGLHRLRLGSYGGAREALAEAQAAARALEDAAREARAWVRLGLVAYASEDYDGTLECVWRGKALGDPIRDRLAALEAQLAFALIEEVQCYAAHTLDLLDAAAALVEATGERTLADLLALHRALTLADAGEKARAQQALDHARNLAAAGQGCWATEDFLRAAEGGVALREARWADAVAAYAAADELAGALGRGNALHRERAEWALALAHDVDTAKAEAVAGRCLGEAERRGLPWTRALALQAQGMAGAARGEAGSAEAKFAEAHGLLVQLGLEPWVGRCHLDHARALARLGRAEPAAEEVDAAVKFLEANRMMGEVARARRFKATLASRTGKASPRPGSGSKAYRRPRG